MGLFTYQSMMIESGVLVFDHCTLLVHTKKYLAGKEFEQISIPIVLYLGDFAGNVFEEFDTINIR